MKNKFFLGVSFLIFSLVFAGRLSAHMGKDADFDGSSMMNFGYTSPFGWLGFIFMTLWWILIAAVFIAIICWLWNRGYAKNDRENEKSPVEVLKERYARGEIDRKEFEEKKKDLN